MNTKRLSVNLEARRDISYTVQYHNKVRGRVSNALNGTKFVDEHDKDTSLGMCYSGIIPWGDKKEGEEAEMRFSATRESLLKELVKDFRRNPEFNIGDMSFDVAEIYEQEVDAGEPGTTGTIKSDTGILTKFREDECRDYGFEPKGYNIEYWTDDHPVSVFADRLTDTLQYRWDQLDSAPDGPGPNELDHPLFDGYTEMKSFSIPLTVTRDHTRTVILSKWEFDYTVHSQAHREALNFAMATGLGARTNYGLGFTSIDEKHQFDGEVETEQTVGRTTTVASQ